MYDLTSSEKANKSALLIVHSKYMTQLAPFVKNSAARLSYIQTDLAKLIDSVCEETGADEEWVTERFNAHLAAPVLEKDKKVKHEELTNPDPDSPYTKNLSPNQQEGRDGVEETDVLDRGEVPGAGREEALEPDARVDLGAEDAEEGGPTEVQGENISTSCFRCGETLGKTASQSPICAKCNYELLKVAFPGTQDDSATGLDGAAAPEPGLQEPTVNPNIPYACTICGREGDREEVLGHIQRDHADVLQRQDQMSPDNMGQDNLGVQDQMYASKEADVPRAEDAAEVEPLPENPGDRFDDYVQKLAETAAARKFSQLSDEDIHSIASQIGASPDDVKNNIKCVAVFGENVGVNGQLGGDPTPPEGYEEISAQGLTGQQPTHDALVPTDLVIGTVANDLNMSNDLAYNMVKDKYGADLPTTYHASISGQVHYYLPSELAANQQQQPGAQQPPQQQAPAAPPQAQPPAQVQPR